jgi:hypothetical protein
MYGDLCYDLQGVIKNIMNDWPRDLKKCDSNIRPILDFEAVQGELDDNT